jgi:hypothetical protein
LFTLFGFFLKNATAFCNLEVVGAASLATGLPAAGLGAPGLPAAGLAAGLPAAGLATGLPATGLGATGLGAAGLATGLPATGLGAAGLGAAGLGLAAYKKSFDTVNVNNIKLTSMIKIIKMYIYLQ